MKRLIMAAVGLALLVGATLGCSDGGNREGSSDSEVVTPAAAPTPTPAGRAVTLDDAPSYLNVSGILPGFQRLDPSQEGITKEAVAEWFGKDAEKFSDFQVYLAEQPFQYVFMTMGVFPGMAELASWKAQVRDEQTFSGQFVRSFTQSFMASSGIEATPQTSITWKDVAVGDFSRLGELLVTYEGGQLRLDTLMMFQENALVVIYDMWYPAEPPTVDTLAMARAVSSNIASR